MVLNYGTLPAIDRNNWKPGIASSTKALCNLKPASPSNIGSSQHGGYTSQGMCCSQTLQDMENYPANIKEILVMFFSWGWFIVDKQHANIDITGSNKTRVSKQGCPDNPTIVYSRTRPTKMIGENKSYFFSLKPLSTTDTMFEIT